MPLFSDFTQDTRLLKLRTPLGPNQLLVECVHGEEALSRRALCSGSIRKALWMSKR